MSSERLIFNKQQASYLHLFACVCARVCLCAIRCEKPKKNMHHFTH